MSIGRESAFLSECGTTRRINQDAVFVSESSALSAYLVADGMGGHAHGELASQGVVAAVKAWLDSRESSTAVTWEYTLQSLTDILQEENDRIFDTYNVMGNICGTTLVLLVMSKDRYAAITIGDSRLYRLSDHEAVQISTDDVWEREARISSGLSEEQIRLHPNYGKLIRAFGTTKELLLHRQTGVLSGTEVFLLCSDGIYKHCDQRVLTKALKKAQKDGARMQESLKMLEQQALQNGTRDNYSAILVRAGE